MGFRILLSTGFREGLFLGLIPRFFVGFRVLLSEGLIFQLSLGLINELYKGLILLLCDGLKLKSNKGLNLFGNSVWLKAYTMEPHKRATSVNFLLIAVFY